MSMARTDAALHNAEQLMEKLDCIPETIIREVSLMAFRQTRYLLRDALMANFRASGIGYRNAEEYRATGMLEQAVRGTVFTFVWNDGRPFIRMSMPANVGKYQGGSSVHVVAASLNYGAVHTPRRERDVTDLPTGNRSKQTTAVLGAKAQRSLKRLALGGEMSQRARASLEKGRTGRDGWVIVEPVKLGTVEGYSKSVRVETSQGDVVVIRPLRFFYISEPQREQFEAAFMAMVSSYIDNALGGAA